MKTNKELKNEYKQLKSKMGVFQIMNKRNGKILLDSSVDMDSRWNRHRTELKFGNHRNKALQSDWNENGEQVFAYEILSEIEHDESEVKNYANEVKELEALYGDELQPFDEKGYNMVKK